MPKVVLETPCDPVPRELEVGDTKKSGKQGEVYFTLPGRYTQDYAVKIYKDDRYDRRRLFEMRDFFAAKRAQAGSWERSALQSIMVPLAVVRTFDGRPAIGFVMHKADDNYCDLAECIVSGRAALKRFQQQHRWSDFLQIARNTAASVRLLHSYTLTHTDIHYRNIMVDMSTRRVALLEAENVILPAPPAVAAAVPTVRGGMRGFIAPEMIPDLRNGVRPEPPLGLPDLYTDLYSLAVLVLHTLLFRNVMQALTDCVTGDPETSEWDNQGRYAAFSEHPFELRNRPERLGYPFYDSHNGGCLSYEMLTPELQLLTRNALIFGLHADRTKRPEAQAWEDALTRAADMLWECRACNQNLPYPFWLLDRENRSFNCPFCGTPIPGRALLLAIFRRRSGTTDGIYHPTQRFYALGPRSCLTERMCFDAQAGERQVGSVSLQRSTQGIHYVLCNVSDTPWLVYTVGRSGITPLLRIAPGGTLTPRNGMILDMGDPEYRVLVRQTGFFA